MHIDLMFNKTVRDSDNNNKILSCKNYFVDVKTSSEKYGRSCSLPADTTYLESFLDKDYWFAFVFRDADYISFAHITSHFVDTYLHLAYAKTNKYVRMDELEQDDVYAKQPDDFIKIPALMKGVPATFNQFYAASGFTGHELDFKSNEAACEYVRGELHSMCISKFGKNSDI